MSSKSVVFYAISSEFLNIALKLLEKLYETKENTLFLCNSEDEVRFFDSKIWTYSKLSFIPHGSASTVSVENAKFCHTWLSTEIELLNNPVCLLHNGVNVEKDEKLKSFEKIIDIFNIDLLDASKKRSDLYKDFGFSEQKLWEQSGASWKSGELT